MMEVSAFMSEQLQVPMALLNAQRHQIETQREAYEAKLEAQRLDLESQAEQRLKNATSPPVAEAISEEELDVLQERVQALHAAQLLEDDVADHLEDIIADCIEVWPTADVREQSVDKVLRMLRLSEKIKVDASLARQLKRKFA